MLVVLQLEVLRRRIEELRVQGEYRGTADLTGAGAYVVELEVVHTQAQSLVLTWPVSHARTTWMLHTATK